jgi:hypothetical protein
MVIELYDMLDNIIFATIMHLSNDFSTIANCIVQLPNHKWALGKILEDFSHNYNMKDNQKVFIWIFEELRSIRT